MAPPPPPAASAIRPLATVERDTQKVIQTLYELMVRVHGFEGADSADVIAVTITDLVDQFKQLTSSSGATTAALPREVIQYVEDGRNPDIYTREFVELAGKQNQLNNGKRRAFTRFRDVLAAQMETAFPELEEEVRKVVEMTDGR